MLLFHICFYLRFEGEFVTLKIGKTIIIQGSSMQVGAESKNAPWRDRTSDPLIKSQLLYQLS